MFPQWGYRIPWGGGGGNGKKGGNEGKLFHHNSHLGNLCEKVEELKENWKGNFVFTTSFTCTVLYIKREE